MRRLPSENCLGSRTSSPRRVARVLGAGMVLWLGLAGCVSPPGGLDGGQRPPRFRNWWNYYQRGLMNLQEARFQESRYDFETAMGQRSGARTAYDVDHWRVRTYGMHVMVEYFPNRELGVALYHLGELAEAERALERSLDQAPSGRAKFFLNEVRRERLRAVSVSGPRISIEPIVPLTASRHSDIRGEVRAEGRAASVVIDGHAQFIELARTVQPFHRRVALRPGTNRIEVATEDLTGLNATGAVAIVADWSPPALLVTRVEDTPAGWILHGLCRDDRGIESVRVDGTTVFDAAADGGRRQVPVRLRIERGAGPVWIQAEDRAGNQLTRSLGASDVSARVIADPRQWVVSAGPAADPGAGTAAAEIPDELPPRLRLAQPRTSLQVFDEEFLLEGAAEDRGGLGQIYVNGEPLLHESDAGALQHHFALRLALEPGTNDFAIIALDRAGNRSQQSLRVVRRIPEVLDLSMRLTLGVPPPAAMDPAPLPDLVHRAMERELLREPPRFHVLERSEGWDYILREQELSRSDLADPASALRIKKLLPAELLLLSSFTLHDTGLTVAARVVRTSDGQVMCLEDVYAAHPERDLEEQVIGLILKIEQRFPLVDGRVSAIEGNRVSMDVGARQGIRSGTRLIAEDGGGETPAIGAVRRSDGLVVELEVDRVRDLESTAAVQPTRAIQALKIGDRVHTR